MEFNLDKELALMLKYRNKVNNAKERKIEWKLSFSQYKKILQSKTCRYTKKKFDLSDEKSDNYITLDRIDSSVGYIPGNVVACSKIANRIKGNIENAFGTRDNVSITSYQEALTILTTCVTLIPQKEHLK